MKRQYCVDKPNNLQEKQLSVKRARHYTSARDNLTRLLSSTTIMHSITFLRLILLCVLQQYLDPMASKVSKSPGKNYATTLKSTSPKTFQLQDN
ncbi:hypothetical protein VTK73DRAFT_4692 [Phialemonium thermophilum]|uniref:Uncharacterized protein n=1 Tax=Phialemonium thermophilum TaxID=223376 RepID=A0ABR3V6V0_9PEZI